MTEGSASNDVVDLTTARMRTSEVSNEWVSLMVALGVTAVLLSLCPVSTKQPIVKSLSSLVLNGPVAERRLVELRKEARLTSRLRLWLP